MATKLICDRCGAEINPKSAVTYAGMRKRKSGINDNDYELCVSCAHELLEWFAKRGIADMPAADVVPVVRCKDCIYARKLYGRLLCKYGACSGYILREGFFCADGARKETRKDGDDNATD